MNPVGAAWMGPPGERMSRSKRGPLRVWYEIPPAALEPRAHEVVATWFPAHGADDATIAGRSS